VTGRFVICRAFIVVATLAQGVQRFGGDAALRPHHTWKVACWRAGAGEVIGVHARFLDRFLRIEPELHGVEENLQRPLRNVIPTVAAKRHHRLSILEHQRRCRSQPWSFARPHCRRMARLDLGLRAP